MIESWITDNESNFGGGVFYCGSATGDIDRSTLSDNRGGGLHSHSEQDLRVTNSTFSANVGGLGAIFNGKRDGFDIASDRSQSSVLSADGRFVGFVSQASNLVPGDTNGLPDVFLYDRENEQIERISVRPDGREATLINNTFDMNADGRFVVFESLAENLLPGDSNSTFDIFIRDREAGTLERLSNSSDGFASNGTSEKPSISADGRFVSFVSLSNNLVAGDTNGTFDIFVIDRDTGSIKRASVNNDGQEANDVSLVNSLSADGRFIAFSSLASNLVPDDTNNSYDVFVFDIQQETIERVSVASDGSEAIGGPTIVGSDSPVISADGRFVAFASDAPNLVPGDLNESTDVFVVDRQNDTIERISVSSDGLEANGNSANSLRGFNQQLAISDDGRLVAFASDASNLVPDDTNSFRDVFVHDRDSGATTRVSVSEEGNQSNGISGASEQGVLNVLSLSGDGRFVSFDSAASNLVPGDSNGVEDVFVVDLSTGQIRVPYLVPTSSTIIATQVTVSGTRGSRFAVSGDVSLTETLLSNGSLSVEDTRVTINNVVPSDALGASALGPLTRFGSNPPVHPVLLGNPAIDNGNPRFAGGTDQRGVPRIVPDIGAFEADAASVAGSVFVDADENQLRALDELGVPHIEVHALNLDGSDPVVVLSGADDPRTANDVETGVFEFASLPAGEYRFDIVAPTGWSLSEPQIQRVPSTQPSSLSLSSELSGDGRFVVFSSEGFNLVPNDNNNVGDVFVYDRQADAVERVSVTSTGAEANELSVFPSISLDGRFVTFMSLASNLVPGDLNQTADVFVYDRLTDRTEMVGFAGEIPAISGDGRFVAFESEALGLVAGDSNSLRDIFVYDRLNGTTERVSVRSDGTEAMGGQVSAGSKFASLSDDGRFVVFQSDAINLVDDDTNGVADIFVFDRDSNTIERVSVSSTGAEGNDLAFSPAISGDGRFVAFSSRSSNLVADDDNGDFDVFVFDRVSRTVELVSRSSDGVQGNSASGGAVGGSLDISGDGRFVSFVSQASNLVPNDTNGILDTFLYDRETRQIERISVDRDGTQANNGSSFAFTSISGDGRFVSFDSQASNLIPDDTNDSFDVFVTLNPLTEPGTTLSLRPGDSIRDLNLGIIPDPGVISGVLFVDSVPNAFFDLGETTLSGWTVFVDDDQDLVLDEGEPFTVTNDDGFYQFANVAAFRNYSLAVDVPAGWEQIAPGQGDGFSHDLFLPPGGEIPGRDFGFVQVSGSGQSSNASVSGRIFEDLNGNDIFDPGVDVAFSDAIVYLDSQNFGVRDENEPAVVSDSQGNYRIDNLGASIVSVATLLDERTVHTSPLGSDFALQSYPLFDEIRPFGNPQAIAAADFNEDGFPDVAVALGEANQISIRLNDGTGGFLQREIDIDLGTDGGGPTSLVVGQFNGAGTPLDIAVTNNFASNVMILLDFDGQDFASMVAVPVGEEPLDIASAQISGDENHLDLVVVNRADNTFQVLTNDGNGGFSALTAVATGGVAPVSVVTGDFTGNGFDDVVVAHASPATVDTPFGDVRILEGSGTGAFTLTPTRYLVQANPTDMVAANFDNDPDGRLDLAVSNFGSNSISILTGNVDGTFTVQAQTLGTSSGVFDITAGDIDNDGDTDVVASNLLDGNISVFRNTTVVPGTTTFQPLEAVGLGQFALAQRMPLVLANFDQDRSAPNGEGTIDIVSIPQQADRVHVLLNSLVDGTHRVELTGLNNVSGLDFIVTPARLAPRLDPILSPIPIPEDSAAQVVTLTGIAKGRSDGPPLRITATSSDPSLIPDPSTDYVDGDATAILSYEPSQDANGVATITVRVTDAGADQQVNTTDDVSITRQFDVTVQASNDPPKFAFSTGVVNVEANSGPQSIADFVTGISPGGGSDESSQALLGFVLNTNPDAFDVLPTIDALGQLTFTPAAGVAGTVIVHVALSDNGGIANQGMDTATATFAIAIQSFDPQSIVLTGSGNTFFLTQTDSQLDGVQLIDIRGSGDNTLMLNADRIRTAFPLGTINVVSDAGDSVVFDVGWEFVSAFLEGGRIVRQFAQTGAVLNLVGPYDFTNPVIETDVDAGGTVSSLDALFVINELSRRRFSQETSGDFRDLADLDFRGFRFYDVTRDLRVTALDALRVINAIARPSNRGVASAEGEFVATETHRITKEESWSVVREVHPDFNPPASRPTSSTVSATDFNTAAPSPDDPDDATSRQSNRDSPLSANLVDDALKTLWESL